MFDTGENLQLDREEQGPPSSNVSTSNFGRSLEEYGLQQTAAGTLTWHKDNLSHPKCWPTKYKTDSIVLVLTYEFSTTPLATSGLLRVPDATNDFSSHSQELLLLYLTFAYNFGKASSSLILPSFSEVAGRKPYFTFSCIVFAISYSLTRAKHYPIVVFVACFVGGLASAVSSIVVAGKVGDLFNQQQRIWIVWAWS